MYRRTWYNNDITRTEHVSVEGDAAAFPVASLQGLSGAAALGAGHVRCLARTMKIWRRRHRIWIRFQEHSKLLPARDRVK